MVSAGSAYRYNADYGAQLITFNSTTAELEFYAATNAADPYADPKDCYRIVKSGGISSYSECTATPPPGTSSFSLLTGAAASDIVGTHNVMKWRYGMSSLSDAHVMHNGFYNCSLPLLVLLLWRLLAGALPC